MSTIPPIRTQPAALKHIGTDRLQRASAMPAAAQGSDRVELSALARLRDQFDAIPDIRQDLINRVRTEIASGNYETPEKIDAVIDDIVEDLLWA